MIQMSGTEDEAGDYGYNLADRNKRRTRCEAMVEIAKSDPCVKRLREAMRVAGCPISDLNFSCEDCPPRGNGYFSPTSRTVVLCQNNISRQSLMTRTLTHELVHAFDFCRRHGVDPDSLKHAACTEIRAYNLDGGCSPTSPLKKMEYVRQGAVTSIQSWSGVTRAEARAAVDQVFDTCVKDRTPLGPAPYSKTDAGSAFKDL